MKLTNRLVVLATSIITAVSTASAHSGEEQSYSHMMWSDGGSWMHSGTHMMGYDMWGMGWFGMFFGLAFWVLVILGIVYLVQNLTENKGEERDE